jgi:IclR family acetate operon transcriptional repressor
LIIAKIGQCPNFRDKLLFYIGDNRSIMLHGTINKVLRVLQFIANQDKNCNIREIASQLGLSKSTLHRILKELVCNNMIVFDEKIHKYQWGPEMIRIAQSIDHGAEMRRLAIPILRNIVDQCNETAILALYDRLAKKIVFTDHVQCDQSILYRTRIGIKLPIHAGASGKSIMAFLPKKEIEDILTADLERVTNKTVTDPIRLKKQLSDIRRKGFAISYGERTEKAVGIAAPFFAKDSTVIGSIVVSTPSYRFTKRKLIQIPKLVKEAAERVSYLNGYIQTG